MPAHVITLLLAYLLGTLAVARAVRLITADAWPPMQNLRTWWEVKQANRDGARAYSNVRSGPRHLLDPRSWSTGWGPLLTCPFCCAPYVTAAALTWVIAAGVWEPDLGTWAGWFWVGSVWASVSYLAAMIVVRDEPAEED